MSFKTKCDIKCKRDSNVKDRKKKKLKRMCKETCPCTKKGEKPKPKDKRKQELQWNEEEEKWEIKYTLK